MKKFEYSTLIIPADANKKDYEEAMNTMGQEGWELVSAFDFSKMSGSNFFWGESFTSGFVLFFKREIA